MKKIIAISVMFALIAGAVFAETSVSGLVETRFTFFDGNSASGAKPKTYGGIGAAYIQLSGTNDEGTLGGTFRFRNEDVVRNGSVSTTTSTTFTAADYAALAGLTGDQTYRKGASSSSNFTSGAWFHRVFVWWKPISQLKIFLGIDQDGLFGTDPLTSWGYHRGSEGFINRHDWGFWRNVFPGNWDGFGMAFSIYPVDGFELNIVIPTGGNGWPQATNGQVSKSWRIEDMYIAGLRLQANYAIDGLGKIFLTYDGGNNVNQPGGYANDAAKKYEAPTNGQFGASFLLTSIEGFQIQVGGSTLLAKEGAKAPLYLGTGVHYDGDGFGAKFRAAYVLNYNWNDKLSHAKFSVMPWYALEKLTVFFDVGAEMDMTSVSGGKNATMIFVNPYITAPLGGGKLQVGLKIENNNAMAVTNPKITTYSLPMLLQFSF